jgi:predicted RNase H-like HicB family nuclease
MRQLRLTGIYEQEADGYVALCPEIDVASQGESLDEARANLREAVELFFESASPAEIQLRVPKQIAVEPLEVTIA